MPKTERAKIKDKLDNEWRIYIYKRAGNKCEYCGAPITLNAHHIFSKSNPSVKWDIDNGVCVCVSHHVFGNMSFHKAPAEMIEWIREARGEEWYGRLRLNARPGKKDSIADLRNMLDYFRKENKEEGNEKV